MLKSRWRNKDRKERTELLGPCHCSSYTLVSCRHASKQMTSRAREFASLPHLDTNLFISLVSIIIFPLPPFLCLLVCWLLDLTRLESLLPDVLKLFRLVLIRFRSAVVIILRTSSSCYSGGLVRETMKPLVALGPHLKNYLLGYFIPSRFLLISHKNLLSSGT
jgi:hypothetical protein